MPRTLTWLHLSDLHSCPRDEWHSEHVTKTLVEDLKHMEKAHSLTPDFIFFTGDAAWGNDPSAKAPLSEQFDIAERFFRAVRSAFRSEIPRRRFYIVPGNHDIDFKQITTAVSRYLPVADLRELTQAFNDSGSDLRAYMCRLEEFRRFLSSKGYEHLIADPSRVVFADEQLVTVGTPECKADVRVGIVGFNSAWSCNKGDTRGSLRLCGEWQFGRLYKEIRDTQIRIGLIHHPRNWFRDHVEGNNSRAMMESFHFMLHGHEHESWIDTQSFPHSLVHHHTTISAGSCYDRDGHPNGYNFVQLDLDKGRGCVYLRRLTNGGRTWSKDTDRKSAPDGVWPIKCPRLEAAIRKKEQKSDRQRVALFKTKPPISVEPEESSKKYRDSFLRAIRSKNNFLDLPGITITTEEARSYDLEVAYVSLSLTSSKADGVIASRKAEELLDELSVKSPRLLIAGPAGCGKTTLIRWLAVQSTFVPTDELANDLRIRKNWADHFLPKTSGTVVVPDTTSMRDLELSMQNNWRQKIPLVIRLRDFPDGALPPLNDIARYLTPHLADPPRGFFSDLLRSGHALVLLDGVDEVPPANRAQLTREIETWMKEYPRCHYIITSRPDAVPGDWLSKGLIDRADVLPLSPDDRTKFIDFWHRSVGKRYRDAGKPDVTESAGPSLKLQLSENPTVARLTTNPLLAAAICALHLDGKAQLPRNEGDVCNKLCELLLDLRDKHQRLIRKEDLNWTGYEKLDYDPHKKAILSDIACAMIEGERSSLSVSIVDGLIGRVLEKYETLKGLDPVAIRKAFIERSGLLRVGAMEAIEFIHNTFREFLAAERWVSMGEVQVVSYAERAGDATLQPVIRFAALRATPASGIADKLVRRILEFCEKWKLGTKDERRRKTSAHFLVIQIAAAAAISPDLQKVIAQLRKKLLPPSNFSDAEAIADCGAEALKDLHFSARHSARKRAACVRALGKMEIPPANPVLDEYLNDQNGTVLAELSRYRNPLTFKSVRSQLLADGSFPSWCQPEYVTDVSSVIDLKSTLQKLDIARSKVTDFTPLSQLSELRCLILWSTAISNLGPLEGLVKLKELDISITEIEDLAPLARMRTLRSLDISLTNVREVTVLGGLKHLEDLDLFGTDVSDVSPLARLPRLKRLRLGRTNVSAIDHLESLQQLETLTLPATVRDIGPVKALRNLRSLGLSGALISNLDSVRDLRHLFSLQLSSTNVDDLSPIAQLPNLRHVSCNQASMEERVDELNDVRIARKLQPIEFEFQERRSVFFG